jgi:hypothetical protein
MFVVRLLVLFVIPDVAFDEELVLLFALVLLLIVALIGAEVLFYYDFCYSAVVWFAFVELVKF